MRLAARPLILPSATTVGTLVQAPEAAVVARVPLAQTLADLTSRVLVALECRTPSLGLPCSTVAAAVVAVARVVLVLPLAATVVVARVNTTGLAALLELLTQAAVEVVGTTAVRSLDLLAAAVS